MAFMRDILDQFNKDENIPEGTREYVTLLYNHMETKTSLFQLELEKDLSYKTENFVRKILSVEKQLRALTPESSPYMLDAVSEALPSLLDNSESNRALLNGIAKIINTNLELLRSVENGELIKKFFLVTVDRCKIIRLDFAFWVMDIKPLPIRKSLEKALVCTALKSEVDTSKLEFSHFLSLYTSVLNSSFGNDMQKKSTKIQEAQEIYLDVQTLSDRSSCSLW